jgi:transcriptional regulator with XRE-family HTH domain
MTLENAARLAQMRHQHGYSQEELAEKLGVSRQAVSKWERAESAPDTDNLIALSRLYGVSLDTLLGLKVPEAPAAPADDSAEYEVPPQEEEAAPEAPAVEAAAEEAEEIPSYYAHLAQQEQARREAARRSYPYPVLVAVAYLVLGFVFHLWHPGWIIFLTIPLFYLPESQRQPVRLLGNPVMITIIYLLLGTMCNWWHPGWLVFLLIPLLNHAGR